MTRDAGGNLCVWWSRGTLDTAIVFVSISSVIHRFHWWCLGFFLSPAHHLLSFLPTFWSFILSFLPLLCSCRVNDRPVLVAMLGDLTTMWLPCLLFCINEINQQLCHRVTFSRVCLQAPEWTSGKRDPENKANGGARSGLECSWKLRVISCLSLLYLNVFVGRRGRIMGTYCVGLCVCVCVSRLQRAAKSELGCTATDGRRERGFSLSSFSSNFFKVCFNLPLSVFTSKPLCEGGRLCVTVRCSLTLKYAECQPLLLHWRMKRRRKEKNVFPSGFRTGCDGVTERTTDRTHSWWMQSDDWVTQLEWCLEGC